METEHFDFIVIGGGSGGYAAARTAREKMERVAIVDGSKELGGLCILKGCMPSKTLIYASEILHHAKDGKTFGLDIPEASVDMPALHRRKLEIIKEFSDYREEQLKSDRFTLFRNQAAFVDESTIELDDGRRLSADYFVIATGSVVSVPPVQGLSTCPYWTSDNVLDLDTVPERIIVLGGGIVACELAQFLRRVGSEVVQVQRSPHLLREFSAEAASVVAQSFRDEGIELHTGTRLVSVQHETGEFRVTFEKDDETHTVCAPHLLNALGRRPATDCLNLEAAGVETLSSGHIGCNSKQQTSNPKIYACGDVAGPYEIVHIAILQGELAAKHAIDSEHEAVDYDDLVSVVFTDPQVATAGLTEEELKRRGIDYLSADYPFDDHGKSILMEAKYGYVKVFAERTTGTVLGAECVSKDAGELIHAMAVAVTLNATVFDLLKVHWYHPTLSEIWSYPLEDIADEI
ncbi:dihydrolipoyl dehydrogenase family protein [Coraliomargarita parva]|uniref:dihydrolipoyl dehydrogenase family protein n=1 Tax=Coraliomargarita parva TaxID=3014050 RepID=UPI0022B366E1|nr:NAD(P)/FAD-dependent oxidoreductase [Coraliomargarita parva]